MIGDHGRVLTHLFAHNQDPKRTLIDISQRNKSKSQVPNKAALTC
jgi:hypothetical protein